MANTAINHILVSEVIIGSLNEKVGNITRGMYAPGASFDPIDAESIAGAAGANCKVTYRDAMGAQKEIYVTETVADMVAKSNGNVAASSL